jgi:hypothetical protein
MKLLSHRSVFFLFCCFFLLAKLALVAHNEIISVADDSASYANQSVGPWVLDMPPGYSMWLRFCQIFGIPQRIMIEGLYLFAVLLVAYAGRKCFGVFAGYAIVASLSFAPSSYFLFDLGLTDGFYTCLTLMALGLSMLLLAAKTTLRIVTLAVGLGGILGIMAITRNEDPLVAFWVLSLVIALAIVWRRESVYILDWDFWRKSLAVGLVASATAWAIVFSLCLSYYSAQGVFARGRALIPGHIRLLRNLARIETGQPQVRFVPISQRSRELAYAVSPTLAKLRPLVENPQDSWQVVSRQFGLASGEIGGGWIWHAINDKMLSQRSPAVAEAEYEKINAELQAAFDDGRLKRRFILHPFIGGNLLGLWREMRPSISAVVRSAFSAQPNNTTDQAFQSSLFDRAFVRRAALVPAKIVEVTVQGWAMVNKRGKKIATVIVSSDLVSSATILSQSRPDVVKAIGAQNGWDPDVVGFHTSLTSSSPDAVKVTYVLEDGTRLQGEHLKPAVVSKIENKLAPGNDILQGIDEAGSPSAEGFDARRSIELNLYERLQSPALRRLGIVTFCLAFLVSGWAFIRERDLRFKVFFIFFSLSCALWTARILFYSLIDARAWPGDQIRYLAPANALALVTFSVSVAALIVFAASKASREHSANVLKVSEPKGTKFSHI